RGNRPAASVVRGAGPSRRPRVPAVCGRRHGGVGMTDATRSARTAAIAAVDTTTTGGAPARVPTGTPDTAQDFADRLFASTLGAIDTLAVYVGDSLGWYRALDESGPQTSAELS